MDAVVSFAPLMPIASPATAPLLVDFAHVSIVRGEKVVLKNLSLQIRQGEHVAILGPNGSGKSTLIKAITRELYPLDLGPRLRFQVLGQDDWELNDLRGHLGIVALDLLQNISHEITLRRVTARELILSGFHNSVGLWPHQRVSAAQEKQARRLMRQLKISHLANRSLAEVSSGEQRRAIIGRALVHAPDALILDEPTNSLDPGAVREFREVLRTLTRLGKTLILITHNISDLIPEIDRVIFMSRGRIQADGEKSSLLTSTRLSRLFRTKLTVMKWKGYYDLVAR